MVSGLRVNTYPDELIHLIIYINFHLLEFVFCYGDPQLQMDKKKLSN